MQIDLGAALTVGGLCIAGLVWLVRLEGRVNVADSRFADIQARLNRIEDKLDEL